MYKAVILPPAKEDIADAAAWYTSKQKGLGKRVVQEVRDKVLFIRQYPKATAVRYNNVRTAVINVFPFMIHYTINEKKETIIISAVFHTALNPDRWTKRNE